MNIICQRFCTLVFTSFFYFFESPKSQESSFNTKFDNDGVMWISGIGCCCSVSIWRYHQYFDGFFQSNRREKINVMKSQWLCVEWCQYMDMKKKRQTRLACLWYFLKFQIAVTSLFFFFITVNVMMIKTHTDSKDVQSPLLPSPLPPCT